MRRTAWLALAWALAFPAGASPVLLKNYGQELIDEAVASHPDLLVAMMHVTPPGEKDNIIIASNIGRFGKKADEDDMRVVDTGRSNLEVAAGGTRFEVELVLQDARGRSIGAMGLVFPYQEGVVDRKALEARAIAIRDHMRRHIAGAGDLVQPYPREASSTTRNHARKLIEQALGAHPALLVLEYVAAPAGGAEGTIVASSAGRVGAPAGEREGSVLRTGKPALAEAAALEGTEVVLALEDARGARFGALRAVFAREPGRTAAEAQREAEEIRNAWQKAGVSRESLGALDP